MGVYGGWGSSLIVEILFSSEYCSNLGHYCTVVIGNMLRENDDVPFFVLVDVCDR